MKSSTQIEIDPDYFEIIALALATLNTIATMADVFGQRQETSGKRLATRNSLTALQNLEDASEEISQAFAEIENVYLRQQLRKLDNSFERAPAFGALAPDFNEAELERLKSQVEKFEEASSKFRLWARHLTQSEHFQSQEVESHLHRELGDLRQVLNETLFKSPTLREQSRRVKISLERVHRVLEGFRRQRDNNP